MNVTTRRTRPSTVESSITVPHAGVRITAAIPTRIVIASTGSERASTSTSSSFASAANTGRGAVSTRGTRRHQSRLAGSPARARFAPMRSAAATGFTDGCSAMASGYALGRRSLSGRGSERRGCSRRDEAAEGLLTQLVSRHRGEERLAGQRPQDDRRCRGDRRRSGHVEDERELAEDVVGTELTEHLPILVYTHAALGDHVDEVTGVPLAHELLARAGTSLSEGGRETTQPGIGQRREDGRAREQLELGHANLHAVVDPPERAVCQCGKDGEEPAGGDQRSARPEDVECERSKERAGGHRH